MSVAAVVARRRVSAPYGGDDASAADDTALRTAGTSSVSLSARAPRITTASHPRPLVHFRCRAVVGGEDTIADERLTSKSTLQPAPSLRVGRVGVDDGRARSAFPLTTLPRLARFVKSVFLRGLAGSPGVALPDQPGVFELPAARLRLGTALHDIDDLARQREARRRCGRRRVTQVDDVVGVVEPEVVEKR